MPKLRLPLAHATLMPPPPAPVIPQPADKNALVLPPEAVKAGSTRFLNGKWRATVALKDPITGKRPGLQYRLNGGKGNAIIAYGDGVSCRVAVEAGLMQSGNLVINSRTKARCSDGSRYQIRRSFAAGRNRRGGVHRPLRCGHHLSHDVQARVNDAGTPRTTNTALR